MNNLELIIDDPAERAFVSKYLTTEVIGGESPLNLEDALQMRQIAGCEPKPDETPLDRQKYIAKMLLKNGKLLPEDHWLVPSSEIK